MMPFYMYMIERIAQFVGTLITNVSNVNPLCHPPSSSPSVLAIVLTVVAAAQPACETLRVTHSYLARHIYTFRMATSSIHTDPPPPTLCSAPVPAIPPTLKLNWEPATHDIAGTTMLIFVQAPVKAVGDIISLLPPPAPAPPLFQTPLPPASSAVLPPSLGAYSTYVASPMGVTISLLLVSQVPAFAESINVKRVSTCTNASQKLPFQRLFSRIFLI